MGFYRYFLLKKNRRRRIKIKKNKAEKRQRKKGKLELKGGRKVGFYAYFPLGGGGEGGLLGYSLLGERVSCRVTSHCGSWFSG